MDIINIQHYSPLLQWIIVNYLAIGISASYLSRDRWKTHHRGGWLWFFLSRMFRREISNSNREVDYSLLTCIEATQFMATANESRKYAPQWICRACDWTSQCITDLFLTSEWVKRCTPAFDNSYLMEEKPKKKSYWSEVIEIKHHLLLSKHYTCPVISMHIGLVRETFMLIQWNAFT